MMNAAFWLLMLSDGSRRKAGSAGDSDTVNWNASSDISKGKGYHKGPQLLRLVRKGKVKATQEQLDAAQRLLRIAARLSS